MIEYRGNSGGAGRGVVIAFGQVLIKLSLERPDVSIVRVGLKMAFDGRNRFHPPARDGQLNVADPSGKLGVKPDRQLPSRQENGPAVRVVRQIACWIQYL